MVYLSFSSSNLVQKVTVFSPLTQAFPPAGLSVSSIGTSGEAVSPNSRPTECLRPPHSAEGFLRSGPLPSHVPFRVLPGVSFLCHVARAAAGWF